MCTEQYRPMHKPNNVRFSFTRNNMIDTIVDIQIHIQLANGNEVGNKGVLTKDKGHWGATVYCICNHLLYEFLN